jgi:hypothetical protein
MLTLSNVPSSKTIDKLLQTFWRAIKVTSPCYFLHELTLNIIIKLIYTNK